MRQVTSRHVSPVLLVYHARVCMPRISTANANTPRKHVTAMIHTMRMLEYPHTSSRYEKIRGACFSSRTSACLKHLTQSSRFLGSNGSEHLASVAGIYFCPAECEAKHSGGRRRENTRHEGVHPQLLLQTPSEFLELRVLDLGYKGFCSSGTSRSRAQAKR